MSDFFGFCILISTILLLIIAIVLGNFYENNKYIEKGYVWIPTINGHWIPPQYKPENGDK